jgi:cytoskeletal protein CcmA (bactofilin family)
MWFKQNEQKSPQQPETPAPRPLQPAAPVAPAQPVDIAPPAPPVAAPAHAPTPAPAASRITSGISVKGDLHGREDLWIGGSVEGKLHFDSARVAVGPCGKIHGEIEAREVVIEGKVDGNLRAAERLEIASTGTVRGDVAAPRVAIQDGAGFNGSMEIVRPGESHHSPSGASLAARSTPASKSARPQIPQAATATASAGAAPAASASGGGPETPARENTAASPALHRGIAADVSDPSD